MAKFHTYRNAFPNARLLPLTGRYTRMALTQQLRRLIDEGVGYGLALEGISAADVARSMAAHG